MDQEGLVKAFEQGEIDIGFLESDYTFQSPLFEEITKQHFLVFLNENHPMAAMESFPPAQIEHEIVCFTGREDDRRFLMHMFAAKGVQPKVFVEYPDHKANAQLINTGVAIGPPVRRRRSRERRRTTFRGGHDRTAEKLGAVILTEAVTQEIQMNGAKITGLTASVAGQPTDIQCKNVILACGAWIRNPEVVQHYFPELAAAQPYMGESPHMSRNYTGDGLKLAQKASAKMDEANRTIRMMGPMTMCRSQAMGAMTNSAYSIYINPNGCLSLNLGKHP